MPEQPIVQRTVTEQVDAIPAWILPLWANCLLVLLGLIVIGLMLFMIHRSVSVFRGFFNAMSQKLADIGDRVGHLRQDTLNNMEGLHHEVRKLSRRVSALENTILDTSDPSASSSDIPSASSSDSLIPSRR